MPPALIKCSAPSALDWWMLEHDGAEVVGPIADWLRETLQNTYSTNYMCAQTAGLYCAGGRSDGGAAECAGSQPARLGGARVDEAQRGWRLVITVAADSVCAADYVLGYCMSIRHTVLETPRRT